MKGILVVVFALCLGGVYAQVQTETRALSNFTGIKASEGIDVYLKKGDKPSARVEVADGRTSEIITEVSGSYLKIHRHEGRHNSSVKVYVTYTTIQNIFASSGSNIYSDRTLEADDLNLGAFTAATIELSIKVKNLRAEVSSAADVVLEGKAETVNIEVSTAGEFDAYELIIENATVEAATAGSAKITVSKSIEGNASSGGSIRYRGTPERTITHSSSGGSVKKSG